MRSKPTSWHFIAQFNGFVIQAAPTNQLGIEGKNKS
jgi:hypothetical protein